MYDSLWRVPAGIPREKRSMVSTLPPGRISTNAGSRRYGEWYTSRRPFWPRPPASTPARISAMSSVSYPPLPRLLSAAMYTSTVRDAVVGIGGIGSGSSLSQPARKVAATNIERRRTVFLNFIIMQSYKIMPILQSALKTFKQLYSFLDTFAWQIIKYFALHTTNRYL